MSAAVELPIETRRLIIRPLKLADAMELHQVYSEPETMQHLATELPSTIEDSAKCVQDEIDLHERTGLSL